MTQEQARELGKDQVDIEYGSTPPRGFEDGGGDGRSVALMMPRNG
jgi:hypothetical protein